MRFSRLCEFSRRSKTSGVLVRKAEVNSDSPRAFTSGLGVLNSATMTIVALPITMSVTGSTANTEFFLNRLQNSGRAVLVGQVNSAVTGSRASMTINLQAFVAQAAG